jgi:hypothetical protein
VRGAPQGRCRRSGWQARAPHPQGDRGARPREQHKVFLSFPEIDAILRHRLPLSARLDSGYWVHGDVATQHLLPFGFAARLDSAAGGVRFTRTGVQASYRWLPDNVRATTAGNT